MVHHPKGMLGTAKSPSVAPVQLGTDGEREIRENSDVTLQQSLSSLPFYSDISRLDDVTFGMNAFVTGNSLIPSSYVRNDSSSFSLIFAIKPIANELRVIFVVIVEILFTY